MTFPERFAFAAYQVGANIGIPLGVLLGTPFYLLSEKRRHAVWRRAGFQELPRFRRGPKPLWIHALSLGEALSVIGLVRALRERLPDRPIVFTTSTHSGQMIARERLGNVVDAFLYFPFDVARTTARMLDELDPAMLVIVETDLWPGFLAAARHRRIPTMLVNGRLSPQTLAATLRLGWLFRPALRGIETIVPQSPAEAGLYASVGVAEAQLAQPGNLKFDVAVRAADAPPRAGLRKELTLAGDALVWIAGSTHPGEEAIICRVFRKLKADHPLARLVLVPRHPRRADEVAAICRAEGLSSRKFSEAATGSAVDVVIVDVMGRLGELYHAADVALAGGSLVPKGGQNPIEPAAAGIPVLFGPDMSDFPDASRDLTAAGAARAVEDELGLLKAMRELITDSAARIRMGAAGRALVEANRGTTERVVAHIANRVDA